MHNGKNDFCCRNSKIDSCAEDAYWQDHHNEQPWADHQFDYRTDYRPAYRLGYEGYARRAKPFEEVESELEKDWDHFKLQSRLKWSQAKEAVEAGWKKVERTFPGKGNGNC